MGKRQQLQAAAEGKGGEEGEISDSGGWQRNLQIDIDPLVLLNHDDRTFRSTSHKGTYEGNIHPDQTHTHTHTTRMTTVLCGMSPCPYLCLPAVSVALDVAGWWQAMVIGQMISSISRIEISNCTNNVHRLLLPTMPPSYPKKKRAEEDVWVGRSSR